MALTYIRIHARMKNHVDIIRVIAIGILAAGDGGGSSRQYGISANVDRRKWRKYKALMVFGGIWVYRFSAASRIN